MYFRQQKRSWRTPPEEAGHRIRQPASSSRKAVGVDAGDFCSIRQGYSGFMYFSFIVNIHQTRIASLTGVTRTGLPPFYPTGHLAVRCGVRSEQTSTFNPLIWARFCGAVAGTSSRTTQLESGSISVEGVRREANYGRGIARDGLPGDPWRAIYQAWAFVKGTPPSLFVPKSPVRWCPCQKLEKGGSK